MNEGERCEGHEKNRHGSPRKPRLACLERNRSGVEQQAHISDVAQTPLGIFLETVLQEGAHLGWNTVPIRLFLQEPMHRIPETMELCSDLQGYLHEKQFKSDESRLGKEKRNTHCDGPVANGAVKSRNICR